MKKYLIGGLVALLLALVAGANIARADSTQAVTTLSATDIGSSTVTFNADVTSLGGESVIGLSFRYGVIPGQSFYRQATQGNSIATTGPASISFAGLACNTTYYFYANLASPSASVDGSVLSFTTSDCTPSVPGITVTDPMTAPGDQLDVELTINGAVVTEYGVEYGVTTSYEKNVSFSFVDSPFAGPDTIGTTISAGQFACGSTYYYRPYADNAVGRGYGASGTFDTPSCLPRVETELVTLLPNGYPSIFKGTIVSTGGELVSTRGFRFPTTGDDNDMATAVTVESGSFNTGLFTKVLPTGNVVGFFCGNTYYYRAYANNSYGGGVGFLRSFNTPACATNSTPIVATHSLDNGPSGVSLIVTADLADSGGQDTNVSFEYGTTTSHGSTTDISENVPTGDRVMRLIPYVACDTTYYVRAKAENINGISYGDDITIKTIPCNPVVETKDATSITQTTVTLNGNIVSLGSAEWILPQFQWGLTDAYTTGTPELPTQTSTAGAYSVNLTNLTCNTVYHYRLRGPGAVLFSYGDDNTFTTLPCDSSGGGGGGGGGGCVIGKVDANRDCRVDILDFVILMAHWDEIGENNVADFNDDKKVEMLDFVMLMAKWTH